ncbi:MAG: hypothetical protein ACP5PT_01630 [Brevinematia bacterium]
MVVLLVSPSRIVRDIFISELIPRGITLLWAENTEGCIAKIEKKLQFDVIVVETSSKFEFLNLYNAIKSLGIKPIFVLYSEIKSQEEIYYYLKLGVAGFLQKPLDRTKIFQTLVKAYESFKGAPPERQVVRVQLLEGEGSIDYTSKSLVKIVGSIIDISIGGLAFSYAPKYEEHIVEMEEIDSIKVILRSEETFVKGKIKTKIPEKRIAVIVFTQLNIDAIQKISKFIFYKTSM